MPILKVTRNTSLSFCAVPLPLGQKQWRLPGSAGLCMWLLTCALLLKPDLSLYQVVFLMAFLLLLSLCEINEKSHWPLQTAITTTTKENKASFFILAEMFI